MIKFSLLGETILEWNDKDIEHYHARRMAMDSMLCRFKATYPAERIDSVRSLLEDKERQMFQIVRLMDEQQSINKKIANQIPVIVQKSVQEQSKKPKRKGFLGIFGVSVNNHTFDGKEYFKYSYIEHTRNPNIAEFDNLIMQQFISLELLLCRPSGRGDTWNFKIKDKAMPILFPESLLYKLDPEAQPFRGPTAHLVHGYKK